MSRLTKTIKGITNFFVSEFDISDCLEKLGILENVEDELGFSLIMLFNALENGIYFRNKKTKCISVCRV